jgi:hypothetical protein
VIVLRTTLYESRFRSVGPAEIEKQRRYTLPGKGHVSRLTDAEFEVFCEGIKLRLEEPTPCITTVHPMDVRERLTDEICNKRRVTTLSTPSSHRGSFFAAAQAASRCAD